MSDTFVGKGALNHAPQTTSGSSVAQGAPQPSPCAGDPAVGATDFKDAGAAGAAPQKPGFMGNMFNNSKFGQNYNAVMKPDATKAAEAFASGAKSGAAGAGAGAAKGGLGFC